MTTVRLPTPAPARPEVVSPLVPAAGRTGSWAAALLAVAVVAAAGAVDPSGLQPFTTLRWPAVATALLAAGAVAGARGATPDRLQRIGLAFGAWMAVATVLAVDPVNAWLGHPRRHLGLLVWVVAAAGYRAGTTIDDRGRRIVGWGVVVATVVVGVGAALERAGVDPAGIEFPGDRLGGFFGQPAYLGAAGVLLAPAAVGVAVRSGGWRRWTAGAAGAAAVGAVVASGTRGAWLGLGVAAVVAAPAARAAMTARWADRERRVRPATVVALLGIVMIGVVALAGGATSHRVADAADLTDGGARGRVDEWRIGVEALAAHPFVGTGPEGYRVVAPSFIDVDYANRYDREVVLDRAHSGPLDVALAGGIPAAVLYVAMVTVALRRVWTARRSADPFVVGLAAGVIGYAAQQIVLFPVAELDPIAWALVGVVLAAGAPPAPEPPHAGRVRRLATRTGFGVLALVVAVTGSLAVVADRRLSDAVDQLRDGDHPAAMAEADGATALRPDSVDAWYLAAQIAAAGPSILDVDAAIERVESGLAVSPGDPALAELREVLVVERAVRSGLPADREIALDVVAERRVADPTNPVHERLLVELGAG